VSAKVSAEAEAERLRQDNLALEASLRKMMEKEVRARARVCVCAWVDTLCCRWLGAEGFNTAPGDASVIARLLLLVAAHTGDGHATAVPPRMLHARHCCVSRQCAVCARAPGGAAAQNQRYARGDDGQRAAAAGVRAAVWRARACFSASALWVHAR
jgi:hypothetical protein